MKPAPFVYHDPRDIHSAVRLLAEFGGSAAVLAGGQSLMPMLNLRVIRPKHVVDLGRIGTLVGIERSDTHVTVGAMTTHRMVETSPILRAGIPLLSEAASHVGHIPIRERGTLGGSLSHADPTAQLPIASLVLGAEMTLHSVRGWRTVPAVEFFHPARVTELAEDEILTSISFPLAGTGVGTAFAQMSRQAGDFPIVGVAVLVDIREGHYRSARIGLSGVSDRPILAPVAEQLVGQPVGRQAVERIADATAAGLDPFDDIRAAAEDRREIARALVRRMLVTAAERASGLSETRRATR